MIKKWRRPKSSVLYVHPPMCERIMALWREGSVTVGEIVSPITDYLVQPAFGIWFTDGEGVSFDFHKNEYCPSEDGRPPQTLKWRHGRLLMSLECFGTPKRQSECFIRVKAKNPASFEVTESFGFIVRSAMESQLVKDSPDRYYSCYPSILRWQKLPATFERKGEVFSDGRYYISYKGDIDFDFVRDTGFASGSLTVGTESEVVMTFALNIGSPAENSYEDARAATEVFWDKELSRINKLPDGIDAENEKIIRNLATTLTQCFCYAVGEKYPLARQGGLQRQIWTFETMTVLESLARIGGFDDYIEPIIDSYFNEFFTESGEIVPLGISWAMITGTVLYSFSKYASQRGKEYYLKYRDRAMRAFDWMKNTRASVKAAEGVAEGLFPPKSSCDDPLVFQSWCNTDTFNLRGLRALSDVTELFGDERADEVREEHDSYLSTYKKLWQAISDAEASDELSVPFSPLVPDETISSQFVFIAAAGYVVEGIDVDEKDVKRILRHLERIGGVRGGLYNRMPDKNGGESTKYNLDENGRCTVWYVCTHEYYWFKYFLRHGMRDKCEEIIRDNLKYAMTDEYYMIERYNEDDPWFTPWSPNASANGRMINMLLDFYS